MTGVDRVTAFAPGSIGNVGPGLDVLGLAVLGAGDTVHAERRDEPGIVVLDPGYPDLPSDPSQNTAAIAAAAVFRAAGARGGLTLRLVKGLPLAGGQGGSAASAAAGAFAANLLLGGPLDPMALVEAALQAETVVAGRQADNVAPSLLGGLVLIRSLAPLDLVRLPVPEDLHIVMAWPHQTMLTAVGRAALPPEVPRDVAMHQAAQVGAIVAASLTGDLALLGRAIDDRIAEPARAHLLPGFAGAKRAALEAGALGCSISGSGPTAFAFARELEARAVGESMAGAYHAIGIGCDVRITRADPVGARVP